MDLMKKLFFVLPVFLIFTAFYMPSPFGQKNDKLYWSSERTLNWSDFKASSQSRAHYHAYSMLSLSYTPLFNTDKELEIGVYASFNPYQSWVKSSQRTDRLLSHEQKHFDLCEVYRRKLKKRIQEYRYYTPANTNDVLKRLFKESFDEYDKAQRKYDEDTNHSINHKKQLEWNARINQQLKELSKYNGDFVTVQFKR